MTELPAPFPFAAITGQPALRQALLLAAVDPRIGGVLVQGPRGTAKSTAARALAALMAPAPFVTVPLGAALEHVTGTLDLGAALAGHAVRFAPGLLARAHGGVLYVDEINLLPDALVDVLLDAAASGQNVVERDGISHAHAAQFVLVGTMNPEEGELRPQLLDRMGLAVQLHNIHDARQRQAIVRARLDFDADPAAFAARHAAAQARLAERLGSARRRVRDAAQLPLSDAVHDAVARRCLAAQVDGVRADLVMLRAARALAAWQAAYGVTPAHVAEVAPLVLAHRSGAQGDAQDSAQNDSASDSPQSSPQNNPPSNPPSNPQAAGASARAAGGDAAAGASADVSADVSGAGAAPTAGNPAGASADAADAPPGGGDWGALPPQPVGMAAVKPVRPLSGRPSAWGPAAAKKP